eukprot:4420052-Amphidinium_carterae.1
MSCRSSTTHRSSLSCSQGTLVMKASITWWAYPGSFVPNSDFVPGLSGCLRLRTSRTRSAVRISH